MRYLTPEMIADAINHAPNPFDAHDVEKLALRYHTLETAQEIAAQAPSGHALRYFCAVLSRQVDRMFGGPAGQIRKTRRVESENLGGLRCSNQEWEKLHARVTTPPVAVPDDLVDGLEQWLGEAPQL